MASYACLRRAFAGRPSAAGCPPWAGLVHVVAGIAATLVFAAAAGAAPARLDVRGWPLAPREAEGVFEPARRAPADSLALAGASAAALARLQGAGWLEARIDAAWRAPDATGTPVLAVGVEAGPRFRWGPLSLDVPREDSAAVATSMAWRPGDPARPADLTAAIERAVADAEAAGHAWARLSISAWTPDSGRVAVSVSGTLGPAVSIEDVRLEGMTVTQPAVARRAMGRLESRVYDPATVRAATDRLVALGVFRRVEYLGLAGGSDWHRGVLRWRVEEPRANTFEGAVGVQGGGTAVGLARLELGNLQGSARSVSLAWQSRGKGLSDFAARYAEPMLFGSPVRLEGALRQQIQDTTYSQFTFGARVRTALGLREHVEAGFEEDRVARTAGEVESADLGNTVFALERDDPRGPRRGSRTRLSVTQTFKREHLRPVPGAPRRERTARASAVEFEGEWHRPLARRTGLSLETRAAGRFSSQRVLDDYERWPLGGASTLRGHDEEAFRVDRYALTRLEWRFFPGRGRERLAVFWDHAEMATRLPRPAGGDRLARTAADGVGFGMRLPAAGGDVDLDYGLEPGKGFLDGKIHLRLVTAF